VSGTGPEERGLLSDPHQIAVRAIYKIPPRTSSAPNTIKSILASLNSALTAFCAVNSHRRCGLQARRFSPAGFPFGFDGQA
jgi:hypothetical protein